jgi:outer membrane lipoprotein LolB
VFRLSRSSAAFTILLLVAACAQQPLREMQRPPRETIGAYSLEGRVSVKRGTQANQAGISWQHGATSDDIELSGPLGQKAARLSRDASGARLETSAHEKYAAADWNGLSERVLAVALPLDNMALWVTGTFGAGSVVERDASGRPLHALENGWQIDYPVYESSLPNALPALIDLRRGDIHVRLKIDLWQLN